MRRKTFKNSNNFTKNKGISLLVLIIIIVIMIILATATILIANKQDLFSSANDVAMKADMMAMLNSQEARMSDLMHDKLGDKSQITEEDFKGIVPDEYAELGFIASKDGMIYAGDDEHTKELAIEMGYIIPENIELPDIEGIFVSNVTTNSARIEIGIEEKPGVKYTYKYSKDNGATWESEVSYETTYQIKGMTDNTTYEIKVEASIGDSKKESGVERLLTKELLIGTVELREDSKAGEIYEEDTWTGHDVYIAVHQSKTGQTSYELNGANTSTSQTDEKVITSQGETNLILSTTDGTNTKKETHKILIDKEAPTADIITSSSTGSIRVDISGAKDNLSGIKNFKFYLNGVLKETQELDYTELSYEYKDLVQGVSYEIRVEIEDNVGNKKEFTETKEVDEITTEEDVQVDINPTDWTNQNVDVKLSYPAAAGQVGQYSQDGINWKDVTEEGKSGVYNETIVENKTIYIRYRDQAGQTGNVKTVTINNIDKILPEIKLISQSTKEATNENVTLSVIMQDYLSGISGYMISKDANLNIDSTGWTNIDRNTSEIENKFEISENGIYYIYVKDTAGNVKKDSINISNIDKEKPKIKEIEYSNLDWTTEDVKITVKAVDKESGLRGYMLSTDANITKESEGWENIETNTEEQSIEINIERNIKCYIYVKDVAGNIEKEEIEITNIDKEGPIIERVEEKEGEEGKVEIEARDEDGYIYEYQISTDPNLNKDSEGWKRIDPASKEMLKEEEVKENGIYYVYVKDLAGNISKKEIVVEGANKTYKISYSTDGGTFIEKNPTEYTSDTDGIQLKEPVRSGYEFDYWVEAQDGLSSQAGIFEGDKTYITESNGVYTMTNNRSGNTFSGVKIQIFSSSLNYIENITAHSTPGTYNETYTCNLETGIYYIAISANGSTADSPKPYYRVNLEKGRTYNVGFTIDSFSSTKAVASKFKFYREGGNVTSIPVDTIQKGDTGDKYFTALWTANSYTATFNGNGGSNGSSITRTYGSQLGTLPTSSRTGYTFQGWYTAASGGSQISSTTTMPAGNVTYYAHWVGNTYYVAYNGNGATGGSTATSTHTYGTARALTANGFTKGYKMGYGSKTLSYTFKNWNTNSSGTGTSYSNGQSVTNLATSGTVTLYAQWTLSKTGIVTATGNSLNMRTGPGSGYANIGTDGYNRYAKTNATATITNCAYENYGSSGTLWVYVTVPCVRTVNGTDYDDGTKSGWVSSDYINLN